MLQINNLTKSFANKVIFDQTDFTIGSGEKIGLVGRNGSGKSTLLKIITKQIGHESGEIIRPNNYKIGYLQQHIAFTQPTVLAESCTALSADQKFDEYLAEKILFGLGFTKEDMQRDPQTFSGGYQIRIQLTKVLLQKTDLLLLDEPTNYLDIISLRWLTGFIKKFDGEVLIISHDRQFMDSVTTHTAMLSNRKIKKIEGRFSKLQAQIKEEEEILRKTQKNQEKRIKELEQFITKFKSKASKAAQAQSKMKMLDKMERVEQGEAEANFSFDFNYRPISAKFIGDIRNLSFKYPKQIEDLVLDSNNDKLLINDLNLSIKKNDRLAIIGKNGKGKTTLLKLLAQRLSPVSGSVNLGSEVSVGLYSQIVTEELDENATIVDEISSVNEELSISQIRNICGIIMFEGDDAFKLIKVLSGGEKSRVSLGKILASKVNLLLLDEPTNHLDVESVDALISALERFPGAVIIVSHDEMVLRKLATGLVVFTQDKAEYFMGGYDDFLEKIGWGEENIDGEKKNKGNDYRAYKQQKADLIKERSQKTSPLKKEIEKLEAEIISLEGMLEGLNQKLVQAVDKKKGEEISFLAKEIGQIEKKISTLFSDLEISSDKLSEFENHYENLLAKLVTAQ